MYYTSKDRRFLKNKEDIRRAYIDLTMKKGYGKVTVSDIAKEANINRMTFYSHYDTVDDIFTEFVDDMEHYLADITSNNPNMTLKEFLTHANQLMFREIDFFRYVAKEGNCSDFRVAFRKTFRKLISVHFTKTSDYTEIEKTIESDLISVCIAYAYLDWLAGEYGDVDIDIVTTYLEKTLNNDNISIQLK